jgi:ribosome biogenesis GTPase
MKDPFDIEEEFFGDDRKGSKEQRKRKEAQDRSKYKKSDLKKRVVEPLSMEGATEGIVTEVSSRGYLVRSGEEETLCHLRGNLKEERHEEKTLVAIGDHVLFLASNHGEGVIRGVLPRRSELVRQDNLTRRKKQIIAANVDLVLITVSVGAPPLRPSIIDRYLIAAQTGGMQKAIVINKIDLLPSYPDEGLLLDDVKKSYTDAKIPIFLVSSETKEGISDLAAYLKGKISVFSGPSGVGKSSILSLLTGMELDVGEVVERTGKGSHTTSNPRLIPLTEGGLTIDTPGIKSFGLFQVDKETIKRAFPEWADLAKKCRFADCTHREEEGCKVRAAVEKGKISPLRYDSYLNLLAELDETYRRR